MLHGFKPINNKLIACYDEMHKVIAHTVALAPNPTIAYTPNPTAITGLSGRYSQVVVINLSGLRNPYFIELKML